MTSRFTGWVNLGPIKYKSWRNPETGERGREWELPGAALIIVVGLITFFGVAVPAIASPSQDSPSITRPDDAGDEHGQGRGDGTNQGGDNGLGRGNDPGGVSSTTTNTNTGTSTKTESSGPTTTTMPMTSTSTKPMGTTTTIPWNTSSTTTIPSSTIPDRAC